MWWIIAIVAVVVTSVTWWAIGSVFPSTGANGGLPTGSGCEFCAKLRLWWTGLSWWKKLLQFSFYAHKKVDCFLRKCPI